MSYAAAHTDAHPKVNLARFGMITFLASEAMLFAGLIGAYIVLWISRGGEFRPPRVEHWPLLLTGANTVLLVSSSFTLLWAEKAMVKGESVLPGLGLTVLLGAAFVGVQAYEWTHLHHEGLWFDSGHTYASSFFTLTGFHGLHVAIGVVFLAIALLMAAMGRFTPHNHAPLECASLYWHFVDIVWIFLFSILYVLPVVLDWWSGRGV
jgi:cytochrome c oxidase subunit 3